MDWRPEDYRDAALERLGEALQLLRSADARYVMSMYAAGVAAECMLRAYHHRDRPFDERHDIVALYEACDPERLGEFSDNARRRFRGAIQDIRLLWLNSYRFASESMVRAHLHRMQLDRGLKRDADALKVRASELFEACAWIVSMGKERWTKS